ncbi:MAG: RES domain-containing protein [Thermomicrobiales bacterium]
MPGPHPSIGARGDSTIPETSSGVLYAAAERRACYLETLDTYRPDRALLQRLLAVGSAGFAPRTGLIPDSYFDKLIGHLRLQSGQRWLDVRIDAPETAVALSRESAIAGLLPELGYGKRLKPGDLVGSDRRLTQVVARWAFEAGFAGMAYNCSHDMRHDCRAIFEGAVFTVAANPSPIQPDDPELIAVARAFELTMSFARGT